MALSKPAVSKSSGNRSFGWQVTYNIFGKAREKALSFRDPRYLALLLIEFFLTSILAGGILLYIDGSLAPVVFPYNLIILGIIAYAVLHFYNYTLFFRRTRQNAIRRNSTMKSITLEFLIFIILAGAAYIYQDPEINVLPYPFNLLLFLGLLAVPTYFYIGEKFINADFPRL